IDAAAIEQIMNYAEDGRQQQSIKSTGVKAPAVTLKSLTGDLFTIGGKTGKPMLLYFWGSWCEACNKEAPTMKHLHERFKDRVEFIGIHRASEEQLTVQEDIKQFIKKNEWSYPVLLDEHFRASELYGLHALPTVFLLDADGNVADTFHMI